RLPHRRCAQSDDDEGRGLTSPFSSEFLHGGRASEEESERERSAVRFLGEARRREVLTVQSQLLRKVGIAHAFAAHQRAEFQPRLALPQVFHDSICAAPGRRRHLLKKWTDMGIIMDAYETIMDIYESNLKSKTPKTRYGEGILDSAALYGSRFSSAVRFFEPCMAGAL